MALDAFVTLLGDKAGVLSCDEKAKVPLGLPAISRSTRHAMDINDPIVTADHTFSIGPQQSITPTVICGVNYNPEVKGKIGPIHAFLRSTKHNGASPATRYLDVMQLSKLDSFANYFFQSDKSTKDVLVVLTDGATEGNPRFLLCQLMYGLLFKELRPTLLVVATNAPGRSCFNPVERAMAFLSYSIGSATLPIFSCGVHMVNGNVIQGCENLELLNFDEAIFVLQQLLKDVTVNSKKLGITTIPAGFDEMVNMLKLLIQYNKKPSALNDADRVRVEKHIEFVYAHGSFSQYTGQLRRCNNVSCCPPPNTEVSKMLENHYGYFPTPVAKTPNTDGKTKWKTFEELLKSPWTVPDTHCPSISADTVAVRHCEKCHKSWTNKEAYVRHMKFLHNEKFQQNLFNNKITKSLNDHAPLDFEEEAQILKELDADIVRREQMGFSGPNTPLVSQYRQFAALVLSGTELPDVPRIPRVRRRASFADGTQVRSYDRSAFALSQKCRKDGVVPQQPDEDGEGEEKK